MFPLSVSVSVSLYLRVFFLLHGLAEPSRTSAKPSTSFGNYKSDPLIPNKKKLRIWVNEVLDDSPGLRLDSRVS